MCERLLTERRINDAGTELRLMIAITYDQKRFSGEVPSQPLQKAPVVVRCHFLTPNIFIDLRIIAGIAPLRRKLGAQALAHRLEASDPRYFTTYYAIDAVNFTPADLSSALDKLDSPYLPLVVQGAAGVPLGPSFSEQKKILQRCDGLFYRCDGGAEARRFNRLLIEAGSVKGL